MPIVAVGENAALPHYKPNKNMSSPVKGEGFLLFESLSSKVCVPSNKLVIVLETLLFQGAAGTNNQALCPSF